MDNNRLEQDTGVPGEDGQLVRQCLGHLAISVGFDIAQVSNMSLTLVRGGAAMVCLELQISIILLLLLHLRLFL